MSNFSPMGAPPGKNPFGMDRVLLRLAVLGVLIVVAFVALFSRLWFLQVLASDDYTDLAEENRIRLVYSEPSRGRILDRNGKVIVQNRLSLAVTVDRQIVDEPGERHQTLRRLSKLLEISKKDLREALNDITVSPYKPVAVAYDVNMNAANTIKENGEDYPGVGVERLPVREYPQGNIAAQFLGYVGEISPEDLESTYFKEAKPVYRPGDIVGRSGLERSYDRYLRGTPSINKAIVNSASNVIRSDEVQEEVPGKDLMLSIDARIQKLTEEALESGIQVARGAGYLAPWGAAVVMDPNNGQVIASASNPTFDPAILADGFSNKDNKLLEGGTPDDTIDDAMLNRVTSEGGPPGSIFKVVTAAAAIVNGIIGPYDSLDCNPTFEYGADNQIFANWTSVDMGLMSLAKSLEVSCDTFYYQLGAAMEDRWGAGNGDGTERFQDYMRKVGFDAPTGIDLPSESGGNVADKEWLDQYCDDVGGIGCAYGWLPGYTVNMSTGQGDLVVTPLQMATFYSAIVNGGKILEPRIGMNVLEDDDVVKTIKAKATGDLGLDATTLDVMRTGLEDVISGDEGTGGTAFSGFPLDQINVAGKTGTAEIGAEGSDQNFAWFASYAPANNPDYVVVVCLYQAGGGGESAAPVARQIYEGIYNLDKETTVTLGTDSGAD